MVAEGYNTIGAISRGRASFVPSRGAHVPSVDFKTYFRTMMKRMDEISIAQINPDVPLEIPEYGLYAVTQEEKTRPGTLFAIRMFITNHLETPFTNAIGNLTKKFEFLDQVDKLWG